MLSSTKFAAVSILAAAALFLGVNDAHAGGSYTAHVCAVGYVPPGVDGGAHGEFGSILFGIGYYNDPDCNNMVRLYICSINATSDKDCDKSALVSEPALDSQLLAIERAAHEARTIVIAWNITTTLVQSVFFNAK